MNRLPLCLNSRFTGSFLIKVLALLSLTYSFASAEDASRLPLGVIKAIVVSGDVRVTSPSGEISSMKVGQVLKEGVSIETNNTSTATLFLSNGSSVVVKPETSIQITQFRQAPVDASKYNAVASFKADPSESHTRIKIDRGAMGGHVAKLRDESTFIVRTPSNDVQILGTEYLVTVTQNSSGELYTVVTNSNGTVVAVVNGNPLAVTPGNSVTIQATVSEGTTGETIVTVTNVGTPQPATSEQIAAANEAASNSNNNPDIIVVSPPPPPPAPPVIVRNTEAPIISPF